MNATDTMPTVWIRAYVIAIAVATYVLRVSFIALFGYYDMLDGIEDHMHLVPLAVLAALSASLLSYRDGTLYLSPRNPFPFAGFVAAVIVWRTESLIGTIVSGFLACLLIVSIPVS